MSYVNQNYEYSKKVMVYYSFKHVLDSRRKNVHKNSIVIFGAIRNNQMTCFLLTFLRLLFLLFYFFQIMSAEPIHSRKHLSMTRNVSFKPHNNLWRCIKKNVPKNKPEQNLYFTFLVLSMSKLRVRYYRMRF